MNPEPLSSEQRIPSTPPSEPISPPPQKQKSPLVLIGLIVLLLVIVAGTAYSLGEKTNDKTVPPLPAEVLTQAGTSPITTLDETADWKIYTDTFHNVSISYPAKYTIKGKLAENLGSWKAGQGLTLENLSDPARPKIFIEAVFDGYGPAFPIGDIKAEFQNNKLMVSKLEKKDNDDTLQKDLIEGFYQSPLLIFNNIPYQFSIYYQGGDNAQIEQELVQILSTFKFLEKPIDKQAYTNNTYGYYFGYAKNLYVSYFGDNDDISWATEPPIDNSSRATLSNGGYTLDIKIYELDRQKEYIETYKEMLNLKIEENYETPYKTVAKKIADITTQGRKGAVFIQGSPEGFQGEALYYYTAIWSDEGRIYKLDMMFATLALRDQNKTTFDQIFSTFKFLKPVNSPPSANATLDNGKELKDIVYNLPPGWSANFDNDSLFISPGNGGYLDISAYNYPTNIGLKEYYCQLRTFCSDSTYFDELDIGNLVFPGYRANGLDNSGGGPEYFGAIGNKFYIIASYNPPSPNEFEKNYQQVLDSLVF